MVVLRRAHFRGMLLLLPPDLDCVRYRPTEFIVGENTLGADGLKFLFPLIYVTKRLVARQLFRVHSCLKGTIHLQTSMPSLGFELRPYGTVVSVSNHFTGWATL
ncbi:hypothetical protein TNCV_3633521 [Trichonephila clavipes]|nr:hypothetical protein TNCV_3633521 [Trichonephila clavipes]